MILRNYCIIALVDIEGILEDLMLLSESSVNTFIPTGNGMLIATFSSFMSPAELTEIFKASNKNFFIFDLNNNSSGFNILKEDINDTLFGFLKLYTSSNLESISDNFMNELASTTGVPEFDLSSTTTTQHINAKTFTDKELSEMSEKERENLMNSIIDKGVENITTVEKKILKKLTK